MAWKPAYIILIILSTFVDYFCGLKMGSLDEKAKRKPFLYISLLSNLGLLFFFKYYGFFADSVDSFFAFMALDFTSPALDLILPMGISFYTFQTMSYSIDIYNGKLKPEKHFGIFALFVSFFPQLVAGPIERASNLLPQFGRMTEIKFNSERATRGLQQMLWGMFKKVVIADRLGVLVNSVYDQPEYFEGSSLLLATVFFSFQIYCDFSGYSDIAIGAAKIMGFDLMKNFDTPYASKTISEFWKRWHISLSTWFRDYVYIPMGGNRVVKWRWYYNLFITFLVSGLWHGANWTFVIWGALHGVYLIGAILLMPAKNNFNRLSGLDKFPQLKSFMDVGITFGLVMIGWVFFRANHITDAIYIIGGFFDGKTADLTNLLSAVGGVFIGAGTLDNIGLGSDLMSASGYSLGLTVFDFILAVGSIIFMTIMESNFRMESFRLKWKSRPVYVKWGTYAMLIYVLLFFRNFESSEFIYFQF
ncbi:MAG: MBOAT family O-acyltransferase [Bacteroidia bacterium]|nr:MBOAT family O-acyltransferase [Bacteroidia bacterium]